MNHKIEKIASCVCGCHLVKFEKWTDDEGAWLQIYENSFYSKQHGRLGSYLKRLWSAIRGKEYLLCEISMSDEDTIGLRNALVEATTPLEVQE
jgi:hypothetical protein